MSEKTLNKITLAIGIALLPPIWAVLAPYIGVTTGAVALICAGVYVANGNRLKDALRISAGFIFGDIWAVIAISLMETMSFDPNLELFLTLCAMGAAAVLIGESFPRVFYTPAWLCGWAIGLTIMGPMSLSEVGTLPIQIGAAMLVGVFYVGAGVDAFQKFLIRAFRK